MDLEQLKKEQKQNPFALLEDKGFDEMWEKEIIYRNINTYLQAKEISDMFVRIQNRNLMPNDFELRDQFFTGLFKEEQQNKNLFYYARKHFHEEKSLNSQIKYENILKQCKRKKHLFWKKYSTIPPKTNELQQTRDQVNELVRSYKIPTLAMYFGVSLGITFLMKLNLNPLSYRVATMVTGLGIGWIYSDFKNSDKIFDNLPQLKDTKAEKEKLQIIDECFSVDPELMAKVFLTKND